MSTKIMIDECEKRNNNRITGRDNLIISGFTTRIQEGETQNDEHNSYNGYPATTTYFWGRGENQFRGICTHCISDTSSLKQ
mmetsp:Transcript_7000/g.17902  ORF Transcript_7000/g.17902 Transcript_7000/m.17902 type:complete len:81 (+) Transcript_7000:710-952(+)